MCTSKPIIIWVRNETDFKNKKTCGRQNRKEELEVALKKQYKQGNAGIQDLYDIHYKTLTCMDVKVDTYFDGVVNHFPIYYVTEKSMRGFDLRCTKPT